MTFMSEIHRIGATFWLRLVQSLNAIAMTLLGGLLLVHESYPSVITGAIAKLPPAIGIPLIFLFGLLVHYALRRAKKVIQ